MTDSMDCYQSAEAEADVVKQHLRGLRKRGNLWIGHVESAEAFEDMLRDLADINVAFYTTRSVKKNRRPLMTSHHRHIDINEGIPFKVLRIARRRCKFGRILQDLKTSQVTRAKDESVAARPKKKRKDTKNVCTAWMLVNQVEMYPEYRVNLQKYKTKHRRYVVSRRVLNRLKRALKEEGSAQAVRRQNRFYIAMSDVSSHCNHVASKCKYPRTNTESEIAIKILELVRRGVTSLKSVESHLKFYIENVLMANQHCPITRTKCYPGEKEIQKRMRQAFRKCRFNSTDQYNVAKYTEELREKIPTLNCFFRACEVKCQVDNHPLPIPTLQDQTGCDILESMAQDCHNTLLFCIQTNFMKELLLKYSTDIMSLVAVYKTIECALPLFLIVTKITDRYVVVGAFVVQFETAQCIGEALSIWRAWNRDVNPRFWLVECNETEIAALSHAFPCGRTVFSDYQREQAWDRWLSRKENGVADVFEVKKLLGQIADSRNEEELKVALSSLEQSPYWLKNEKLQKYITRWLSVKEKWVKMHRLDLPFDNYNGADLKFELTRTRGQPNLLELVRTLVEECFPVMEAQFLQANASSPNCTPNMLEYAAVFKEKPDTLAQCATASTSSEQCSMSPAKHSAEDVSDLQQPCERSQDYLMSQIKTQTRKIASEVDHMHDSTVLQEVLAILTEAKTVIREDLANSIDIAI